MDTGVKQGNGKKIGAKQYTGDLFGRLGQMKWLVGGRHLLAFCSLLGLKTRQSMGYNGSLKNDTEEIRASKRVLFTSYQIEVRSLVDKGDRILQKVNAF